MEKTFFGSAGSRYTTYDLKETLNGNVIEFSGKIVIDEKTKAGNSIIEDFNNNSNSTVVKVLKKNMY